jgi:NAD-dependent deacetylase
MGLHGGMYCVLTGAGISTESGIPDFRGPNGVWTKDPAAQRMFTLDAYVSDPALRVRAWRSRMEHAAWTAEPNDGHRALVDLERKGLLHTLVTQNIDGLHQKAGNDPALVVEMHGTLFGVECLRCGARTTMADALDRVRAGEEDPPCLACGGVLKSATVSFGQSLDPADVERARVAAVECGTFLAVGTSLTVHPVAALAPLAKRAGAQLVIVNAEPTPYDGIADEVVREPIGLALPRLVGAA